MMHFTMQTNLSFTLSFLIYRLVIDLSLKIEILKYFTNASVLWEKRVAKFEQKLLNSQNLFCKL